ncbi:MAG: DUF2975 domain-containing protein [Chitinophagales bacterium]|nr:DUF2975 domain-containing protein [Chitinophagales bacterium]
MKLTTKQILKVLYVLAWIIFIGLCVEAGGILFNTLYTIVINPIGAQNFWKGIDLSGLYNYDKGYYMAETMLMSIVSLIQAILFYFIVKVLHDKKLDMLQPFSAEVKQFISKASYLSMAIGLVSFLGIKHTERLLTHGVVMPDVQQVGFGGADVWIFMGIVLLVIVKVFERGIEIQAENDLTI